MNETRYKKMKIYLGILIIFAVILFCLQNFGLPFLAKESMTQYYRANQDIKPYMELTADMFSPVEAKTGEVPAGLVTNFSEVEGLFANGTIHKGEYLSLEKTMTSNGEENCVYTMEINADYSGPVQYDDYIDVYTLSKDNVPALLFKNKKLYSAGGQVLATDGEQGTTQQTVDKKYIKVTKEEMLEYYSKLHLYQFIILPTAQEYAGADALKESGNASENGQTAENQPTGGENNSFQWTVKTNETWDSIAKDWNVSVEDLKALNPSVDELKEGITIMVPAEK